MDDPKKTSKQYDRWSKIYDHTFGALVKRRIQRGITELKLEPGDRVLDMGIGTGNTLGFYPHNVNVVGLDFSAGMIGRAAEKVAERELNHVRLVQADALQPPFADASFDHVLISHVISVVSDPVRLMQAAARVLKPGGRLVLVNHFRSPHRVLGALGKAVNPICKKIGWRSDLTLDAALDGCPLPVQYQFKLSRVDLWKIVVLGGQTDEDLALSA